jgi:type IV pilus assembly protein PilN
LIRINLLPIRAFRRKESIRKQVSIYFLSIIFLAAILGFAYVSRQGTVRELQSQQEALKARKRNWPRRSGK